MTPGLPDFVRLRRRPALPGRAVPERPELLHDPGELDPQAARRQAGAPGVRLHDRPPAHARHRAAGHRRGEVAALGAGLARPISPRRTPPTASTWRRRSRCSSRLASSNLELETVFNSGVAEQGAMSQIWQSDLQKIGVTLKLRGLRFSRAAADVAQPDLQGLLHRQRRLDQHAADHVLHVVVGRANQRQQRRLHERRVHAEGQRAGVGARRGQAQGRCSPTSTTSSSTRASSIRSRPTSRSCLASSKVKDIGNRRIPLFKFTETWLDA